jgi:ABC-type nitrate/sulfonate/bicarbonate transport system substrate-binding protein
MKQLARGLVAVSALAVALAGCGSNGSNGTDGSDQSGKNLPELTVIVAGSTPTITGTLALGIAEGIFQDAGVKVSLKIGEGAQAVNAMVAGQADLTEASATSASSLEAQGKDISAVWASSGGGLGLKLFTATDGPKTLEEFQDQLAGKCTAGVTAPGSSGYGYMALFNDELGLDCELRELGDTSQILGALLSGRVDSMLSTANEPSVAAAIEAGQVNILLDTANPEEIRGLGIPQFPDRVFFGLKSDLDAKSDAMQAFAVGMNQAASLYSSMDADGIADAMLSIDSLQSEYPTDEDRTSLVGGIKDSKPFVNWADGYISEGDWNTYLNTAANWGIDGFDASDPKRSYASVVDMSFYDSAR